MERFPSTLAAHPPLARNDQLRSRVTPDDRSGATVTPLPTDPTARVDVAGGDRPCHLPMAWAARPDLDHGHVRRSA